MTFGLAFYGEAFGVRHTIFRLRDKPEECLCRRVTRPLILIKGCRESKIQSVIENIMGELKQTRTGIFFFFFFFLVETAHFIINSYIIQLMLQQIKQNSTKRRKDRCYSCVKIK